MRRTVDEFSHLKQMRHPGDSEVPRRGRGEHGEVRGQEQSMHSRVNTNETRRECQRRQAPGSPTENHSFTARKPIQRKNSRTSSYENKVEMQDITRKYKVVNCVDEKILKWNTELIEAMELEHVTSPKPFWLKGHFLFKPICCVAHAQVEVVVSFSFASL